ncbi:MAG: hypothetical protein IPN13_17095 [Bacteroidetes bacterium]|nr:hypothetical protein [Bacteroidota bacterium]
MDPNQSNFLDKYFELFSSNDVEGFSENLKKCLVATDVQLEDPIDNHRHYRYLVNYLSQEDQGLKVKLILLEKHYTSESYLEDYSNYYYKSYKNFKKHCIRLHFFGETITHEEFLEAILNCNLSSDNGKYSPFWNSYKGYVVVKPLPRGIIGATVLKHYETSAERKYTVLNEYPINIFGKKLKINTLPFQEQDASVSNCASSALWSCFHHTSYLFKSKILSPSAIILNGGGFDNNLSRKYFPSVGMDLFQISSAILAADLFCEIRTQKNFIRDQRIYTAFIYAYLRMGIPVLVGYQYEKTKDLHLVVLSGYKFSSSKLNIKESKVAFNLMSDKICKFYSHDDQLGPFSRLELIDEGGYLHIPPFEEVDTKLDLKTSTWIDLGNSNETFKAKLTAVIVPISKKIGRAFEGIFKEAMLLFDKYKLNKSFHADIFIIQSSNYKIEILDEIENIDSITKRNCMLFFDSLPEYIWVIKIYKNDDLYCDFLFDAIDAVNSKSFSRNIYHPLFIEHLKKLDLESIFSKE